MRRGSSSVATANAQQPSRSAPAARRAAARAQVDASRRTALVAATQRIEPAASRSTGLKDGDVIVAINDMRVRDAARVAELLGALQPRQAIRLYFERNGAILFTDLAFS